MPRSSAPTPRGGGNWLVWLFALAALAIVIVVLAVAAIVLVPASLLLAWLVVAKPDAAGARIRGWRIWKRLPGTRNASRGAAGFAALILLYGAAIPGGSLALVMASSHSQPDTPAANASVGQPTAGLPELPPSTPQSEAPAAEVPSATPTSVPTPAATPAPTPKPTPTPTPAPTPKPTLLPTAPPTNAAVNLCGAPPNPWNFNFCSGSNITDPPSDFCGVFDCIPSFWNGTGYVEECVDGTYSLSGGHQGSCSYHHGNWRALLQP